MPETKKYYHNLDVDNNKVINPLLNPLTTVQRTAVGTLLGSIDEGYVCFDTTLNQQYFWDGTTWITTGGGSAVWGSITGTLTAQTDLTAYLAANYYPLSSNPAGYLTTTAANLLYYPLSSNPANYLTSTAAAATYVPYTGATGNVDLGANDIYASNFAIQPTGYGLLAALTRNLSGSGYGAVTLKNGAFGTIQPTTLLVDRTYTLPDATGTFTLSVNGIGADSVGNVTIPVGTGTVTGTGTPTRVAFWDSSSSISSDSVLYWDNINKRLGIGTATPSKALDVTSDALVNGALLGIGPNVGSTFPNTNIVFGTNALAANTTGYYNAAIGTNAMNANTTGYYNLAIGYDALKVNLISRTNIAIGAASLGKFIGDGGVNGGNTGIGALTLRDNVTGLYNTAIGYGSILSITGNSFNSAIGYSALRYATTAEYNTAIGTYAGSYYGLAGATTLTVGNNGTFIGYYSRPLNNSSTNEIVIGYNSVGNGNNSTTIGNSGTTSTNLFGSLGFGSTPSYGTSGQVLTSSGAGVAPTWTTVTSGSTRSVNVVSSNTSAGSSSGTDYVYLVSGTTTITLPTPVGNTNLYTIKRVGTNTVSIATTSGTIDGSTSPITINVQYVSLDLISDGTNWNII
jgi:hypothetical protein